MTSNRMIQTRFPYKSGVKGRKTSNNNISNNNMVYFNLYIYENYYYNSDI